MKLEYINYPQLIKNLQYLTLDEPPRERERERLGLRIANLPFEALEARHEGGEAVNGVVLRTVRVNGVRDAGNNGGDFLLDDAVVGSDRLLVVLERDPQELVLQLERLGEVCQLGGRRSWRSGGGGDRGGCGGGGGGGGGSCCGGWRAVGERIHENWRERARAVVGKEPWEKTARTIRIHLHCEGFIKIMIKIHLIHFENDGVSIRCFFFIFLTGTRRVFILYTLSSRFLRLMFHFTFFFLIYLFIIIIIKFDVLLF